MEIKNAPEEFKILVYKIADYIEKNPDDFFTRLKHILGVVRSQSGLIKTQGYCGTFRTPLDYVLRLAKKIGIEDPAELSVIGAKLFGLKPDLVLKTKKGEKQATNIMHSDPYYIFNLAVIAALLYLAKKEQDPQKRKLYIQMAQIPLFLILVKLWNGRLKRYFTVKCNPQIMKCVIKNKLSEKSLLKKYDNPLELITMYFVPTLFSKYALEFYKTLDVEKLKALFKQSWNRIDQIFLWSGKRGGLAVKYYEAYENKECSSSEQTPSEDEDINLSLMQSQDAIISELADKIKHFIMLTDETEIPEKLFRLIYVKTKIRKDVINKIPLEMKNPDIIVNLSDVIALMIRKLNLLENKKIVCSPQFYIYADSLIRSKNNPDIKYYKEVLTEIAKIIEPRFENMSKVSQINILRAINFVIAYYIQKYICEHAENEEY